MHAKYLAQVAMNLASFGNVWTAEAVRASGEAAHGYWLSNRFRFDSWHQRISTHRIAIERVGTSRRRQLWLEILPTLEEILISEPLTRLVAYVAANLEQRGVDADWGALSHSVLSSHIEARHRCLNLMVFGYGFPVERAVSLNHLRRTLESYNDQLLGSIPSLHALDQYVFDLKIAQTMQKLTRRYPVTEPHLAVRFQALWAALESSIRLGHEHQRRVERSPCAHWNQGIAESALAILPPEAFDSFGVPRGRLQSTLAYVTDDRHIATDDLEKPLAAPFDLLSIVKRDAQPKGGRLGG